MVLSKTFSFIPKKRRKAEVPTVVTGPVLVSAAFDFDGPSITLTFDRDIVITGYDGAQLSVLDGEHTHMTYLGTDGTDQTAANQVLIYLNDAGAFAGSATTLNATPGNGIRALSDNAPWAGVSGFPV